MTKRAKIEAEIERCRNFSNWNQLRDDGRMLAEKVGKDDGAVILLQCEVDFEQLLLNPGKKMKYDLEGTLRSITFCRESRFDVQLESKLILSRLLFHRQEYSESLQILETINICPTAPKSPYKARLTAQALAVKALATEKAPTKSFTNLAIGAQNKRLIDLFDAAAKQTISFFKLYLEQLGTNARMSPNMSNGKGPDSQNSSATGTLRSSSGITSSLSIELNLSPVIDRIFEKLPKLHAKEDKKNAIFCYRSYLMSIDSRLAPQIKAQLARDCGLLLLANGNRSNYSKPILPKKATLKAKNFDTDKGLFSPETVEQEVLLLLLVADTLHEYVIDRAPEYDEPRRESLDHATNIIDLITVCLSRVNQYFLITQRLEKTLKFAYQNYHLNFQFALSLISSGRYTRALMILDECILIKDAALTRCIAADISLFKLHNPQRALQYIDDTVTKRHPKAYGIMGECHSVLSSTSVSQSQRAKHAALSLESFSACVDRNPKSYQARYRYALQLAKQNRISSAMREVETALKLNPDCGAAFLLLQLLLSVDAKCAVVLHGAKCGINRWPNIVGFHLICAKLLIDFGEPDGALEVCKNWIKEAAESKTRNWKDDPDPGLDMAEVASEYTHYTHKTQGTLNTHKTQGMSDIEGGFSVHGQSTLRTENALSEIESALSGKTQQNETLHQNYPLTNAFFQTAEILIDLGHAEDAQKCLDEAQVLMSGNRKNLLYIRGRLAEMTGNLMNAVRFYQESLSIDPAYFKSLLRLGNVFLENNETVQAEKCFRDAIVTCPSSSEAWKSLGLLLEASDEESSNCLLKAAELELFHSIIDYSICPLQT